MKIGINASFLEKRGTGIGQVTESILITLSQMETGHKFIIYTHEKLTDTFLEKFTTRVIEPRWRRRDLLRLYLWERFQLPKAVKHDKLDAFISLYQCPTVLPRKIQHTMVVHDLIPELFPEYQRNWRQFFYWLSTKGGIQKVDQIVAVSQSTRDDLRKLFPLLKTPITVAHPAIPVSFVEALEDTAELPNGEYIYNGGGLEIRKNTETLLRAYEQFRAERKKQGKSYPKLFISGKIHTEDNPLAFPISSYLREKSLEEDVVALGYVSQGKLKALYRHAKFFVYPSVYEGFGLPVLEALAMGTPTIASKISSIPEVAKNAVLYFRPEDEPGLLHRIKELDENVELRTKLKDEGQKQVTHFSWHHFVEILLQSVVQ